MALILRVWDGSTFIKIGAAFADVAGTATVSIASGAIVANSAVLLREPLEVLPLLPALWAPQLPRGALQHLVL